MGAVLDKLTAEQFRAKYGESKPYFELLDGEVVQKPLPTNLHSILQLVLALTLKELGFKARPELTLAIDAAWEPTPDVSALTEPIEEPYPSRPIAVAIEVLSPDDRFTRVIQKCRRYASWGVKDILIFDPADREAWCWDRTTGDVRHIQRSYVFTSRPAEILLQEVWRRVDDELK